MNVILILADDMGYGDFGVFGDGNAKTPNLDALTRKGVTLRNYYTPAPVCAPARAGILTGRYPQRTGVIDTLECCGTDRLGLWETTLADVLKKHGYDTGLVGKWHLGAFNQKYHPLNRGFCSFTGFAGGWSDYYQWTVEKDGAKILGNGEYLTDFLTQEAVNYIERHKDRPFFLHVAYNAPHFPFQAPEKYTERFSGRLNETVRTIYGMIACMDEGIGRIMLALEENGILEDTLVIFASDNGPQLAGEANRYNCGLNGEKATVYDGGIKVPALVYLKGRLEGGQFCDAFVHGCDWFPTILHFCGIPIPSNLDGKDVSEALLRNKNPQERTAFWQWTRYEPMADYNGAVRSGEWKLVRPPVEGIFDVSARDAEMDIADKNQDSRRQRIQKARRDAVSLPNAKKPELFCIKEDPEELHDLADQFPQKVQLLEAEFDKWFQEVEKERWRGK